MDEKMVGMAMTLYLCLLPVSQAKNIVIWGNLLEKRKRNVIDHCSECSGACSLPIH